MGCRGKPTRPRGCVLEAGDIAIAKSKEYSMKQHFSASFRMTLCALAIAGGTAYAQQPMSAQQHMPAQPHTATNTTQQHAGSQDSEFERNALRRCDIFKTQEDRHACVGRVRQPTISGSVEGGGVIREYTQQITVPQPAPSPAPAPMPAPAATGHAPAQR